MTDLSALQSEATTAIQAADSLKSLDEIRVAWLGKKGKLTEQLKGLASA